MDPLKEFENETEFDDISERDSSTTGPDPTTLLERSIALLYLKLQAKHHVTNTVIQTIIDELFNIHHFQQEHVMGKLKNILLLNGLSLNDVRDIFKEFDKVDVFRHCHNPSSGILRTNFCRNNYYKNNFLFISPEPIYLGLDSQNRPSTFHYVPILNSLQALFKDSTVRNHYLNKEANPNDGEMQDFTDGSVYKGNDFFQQNPSALRLILYQDAFEVVNPLGSAKKKHKILAVYFSLGNVHSYCRTKTDAIQLVLLCKETHFNYFGQEKIFGPLIRDLKILEKTGVELPSLNIDKNVRGSVVFISGDSLGSNCIGGFVQNFSRAKYCCRYCVMKTEDFPQSRPCNLGEKRDINRYNIAVNKVCNDDQIENFEGVKFDSAFNQLNFYHVCSPGLPPCLAHDLFEGVLQYDMALILTHFIKAKKWFTWNYISRRFQRFPFLGDDSRDKPNVNDIKEGEKVGGQAFQTWVLMRFIPLIIGNKIVDKTDKVWVMFCLLQKIVQIVLSPRLKKDHIGVLSTYLEEYMEYRTVCFLDHKLKPKHHFLCHYPELILQFGPPVRLWTMRYESKHSYFKKSVRHCQNFKNVTKMVSHRHQLLQAYYSAGNLFGEEVQFERSVPFNIKLYSKQIQHAVLSEPDVTNTGVSMTEKVEVKGTEYTCGSVLVLGKQDYSLNVGVIAMILVSAKSKVYFIVKRHEAEYIADMNYYMWDNGSVDDISGGEEILQCVSFSALLCHSSLQLYTLQNKNAVVLKHAV